MKHTPGPWEICGFPDLYVRYNQGYYIARVIKREQHPKLIEEAEGNAHLIAAAPDLLEACKSVIGLVKQWEGKDESWDRLNTAITKAEGK